MTSITPVQMLMRKNGTLTWSNFGIQKLPRDRNIGDLADTNRRNMETGQRMGE